jgi:hypothetical protein
MPYRPIEVILDPVALEYAAVHAMRRAKRTATSPVVLGDDGRPDRDYVGVVCELGFYQWRYGDWRVRKAALDREVIGHGLNDAGEDDVGINVRGSNLPPNRELARQHLLVSVDPKNRGKCYPHIRYVAAFYDHRRRSVWLAGYALGQELDRLCPEPRRVATHGFLSRVVPVTALRPVDRLPHVGAGVPTESVPTESVPTEEVA